MLAILYSFRRCPYAIRTRYALALLGQPVALREVSLKSKPPALLALGGRTSVPQLVDLDGSRYPESMDIIYWAIARRAGSGQLVEHSHLAGADFWPAAKSQQQRIEAWVFQNDHRFKYWLDRYKYADRFPQQTSDYYRQQGERFLRRLEASLRHSAYLLGDTMSLADVAVFPFIRQFVAVDPEWFSASHYKHVKIWLASFLQSDVFALVMKKYPVWQEGQPEVELFLR